MLQHLKTAGFKKKFGFTCSYLFQLVFVLLFHHKNWFRLLESEKAASFPGKDAVYRFLNHSGYAWRRFLTLLSTGTAKKVQELTGADRVSVFVVDDSMFERNRSKTVELLSRFKDHATGCYYKGFRMLTLGWSDGHTFIPVDFLASLKSQVNGIMEGIDKRTSGYKRRMEALLPAPTVITAMIDRGLDVIGMVKADKKRYLLHGRRLSLQELYFAANPLQGKNRESCVPSVIVFSRYILLAWQHRQSTDNHTLGGLFHLLCDEVSQLDWAIALRQLIDLIGDLAKKANIKITALIQTQLQQWIAGLPSYIKGYLPNLRCES